MATVLDWCVVNAIAATVMALIVGVVARWQPRPAVLHSLWVVVLARLVFPPMIGYPAPEVTRVFTDHHVARSSVHALDQRTNAQTSSIDFQPAKPSNTLESTVTEQNGASALSSNPSSTHANELGAATEPKNAVPDSPSHSQPLTSVRPRVSVSFLSMRQFLFAVWIAGSALVLIWSVLQIVRFSRIVKRGHPASEALIEESRQAAVLIGLRKLPQIIVVDECIPPSVWPLNRLSILYPKRLLEESDRSVVSLLISHELIHIRRRDHWVRYLELLATIVFWWLPTLWCVRAQLRRAEEAACDAWLVNLWPARVAHYANGLVNAAQFLSGQNVVLPASGLSELQQLESRLKDLFGSPKPHRLSRSVVALLLLFAVLSGALGPFRSNAADSTDSSERPVARNEELVAALVATLGGAAVPNQTSTIERLELGVTKPVQWKGAPDPVCEAIQSVSFGIERYGMRFREVHDGPFLRLDLNLSKAPPPSESTAPLSLIFYDDQGQPVETFAIPVSAIESLRRPAEDFLNDLRQHSRLWIDPDIQDLPQTSYRFHHGKNSESEHSIQQAGNPHYQRGVTLTVALDSMLKHPRQYRLPVLFHAEFEGAPVDVAIVTGPPFGWVIGNGIDHGWTGGYTVSRGSQVVFIVDQKTRRPLAEIHEHGVFRFLDYSEPQPGQYVPRRIAFQGDQLSFDFRFQVVDGRIWLFDRSINDKGEAGVFVSNVLVADQTPKTIERSDSTNPVERFKWTGLTNRVIPRDSTSFEQELVQLPDPTENPQYRMLGQVDLRAENRIRLNLNKSFVHRSATHWMLTRTTDRGQCRASTDYVRRQISVAGIIPISKQPKPIDVVADSTKKTRLQSLQVQTDQGGHLKATVQMSCDELYTDQYTVVTGVLFNAQSEPIAAARLNKTYRVKELPHTDDSWTLDFGVLPAGAVPTGIQLGIKTQTIGAPMGSLWGRVFDSSPIMPHERLLESRDSNAWSIALEDLYQSNVRHPRRFAENLKPFREQLEPLFAQQLTTDQLSLLCRLAGYSRESTYLPKLIELLDHDEPIVRDSAAIGLGLLKDSRAADRLREIAKQPDEKGEPNPIARDARNALSVLSGIPLR